MSVPICGLAVYNVDSGAPKLTNSWRTLVQKGLWIPLVNLPSEKVPAPPSPNWTFDKQSNLPVFLNISTTFCLFSTLSPCSITIGVIPFWTKVRAANKPLGPAPTITTFLLEIFLELICGNSFFTTLSNFLYLSSFFNAKFTE